MKCSECEKISRGIIVAFVVPIGVVISVLSAAVAVLVCRRRKTDPPGELICAFTHHFIFLSPKSMLNQKIQYDAGSRDFEGTVLPVVMESPCNFLSANQCLLGRTTHWWMTAKFLVI